MMSASSPIGVFDSGLGGLTALRRLRRVMPHEDFIYFGDTARIPYGGRDRETLMRFARGDIAFLQQFGVKAVLVACGTISSVLLEQIRGDYAIPLAGVIESAAAAAARATQNGRIGVWGTAASIASGAYARKLGALGYEQTVCLPCPKLVPLIESGHTGADDPQVREAVREYLEPVCAFGADTLILGCTHYPLLEEAIRAGTQRALRLIDSGGESASLLLETLRAQGLLRAQGTGKTRYFVSGRAEEFIRIGGRFLGEDLAGKVEQADAESFG